MSPQQVPVSASQAKTGHEEEEVVLQLDFEGHEIDDTLRPLSWSSSEREEEEEEEEDLQQYSSSSKAGRKRKRKQVASPGQAGSSLSPSFSSVRSASPSSCYETEKEVPAKRARLDNSGNDAEGQGKDHGSRPSRRANAFDTSTPSVPVARQSRDHKLRRHVRETPKSSVIQVARISERVQEVQLRYGDASRSHDRRRTSASPPPQHWRDRYYPPPLPPPPPHNHHEPRAWQPWPSWHAHHQQSYQRSWPNQGATWSARSPNDYRQQHRQWHRPHDNARLRTVHAPDHRLWNSGRVHPPSRDFPASPPSHLTDAGVHREDVVAEETEEAGLAA